MSGESWDDQQVDVDVVAFGGFMRDLGDRLASATADSGERVAEAIERGMGDVAEALRWVAYATKPEMVPHPNRREPDGGEDVSRV